MQVALYHIGGSPHRYDGRYVYHELTPGVRPHPRCSLWFFLALRPSRSFYYDMPLGRSYMVNRVTGEGTQGVSLHPPTLGGGLSSSLSPIEACDFPRDRGLTLSRHLCHFRPRAGLSRRHWRPPRTVSPAKRGAPGKVRARTSCLRAQPAW